MTSHSLEVPPGLCQSLTGPLSPPHTVMASLQVLPLGEPPHPSPMSPNQQEATPGLEEQEKWASFSREQTPNCRRVSRPRYLLS